MTEQTMTNATVKAFQDALHIAQDNGYSLADPIHLASAIFANEDSVGAQVAAQADSGAGDMNGSTNMLNAALVQWHLTRLLLEKTFSAASSPRG
eukprot:14082716-Ditylum_brightwellii.AAC.1